MRWIGLACVALLVVGCSSPEDSAPEVTGVGWACHMENRSVSRFMGEAAQKFALGDDAAWRDIKEMYSAHRLDGIAAECFDAGLGEIFARSPGIFLERYLAGDETAKELAWWGYRLIYYPVSENKPNGDKVRKAAMTLYQQRRTYATPEEKERVDAFLRYITSNVDPRKR